MEQKATAKVDIGTHDQPKPIEMEVTVPTVRQRQAIASYQMAYMVTKSGPNLDTLVNHVFNVLDVTEEQLVGLNMWDRIVLGQRLGNWAVEKDGPFS